jgi:hypothetical protein
VPDPSEPNRALSPLRLLLRIVLSILLILWTLLDTLLSPVFRPLLRFLGSLRIFETLGAWLGRLPPYAALLALAVPYVIVEPAKVFALYWLGIGHVIQGGAMFVAAHVLSILVLDRVYHAAHAPLMRIGWFARLMGWLAGLRDLAMGWARSTAVWQTSARLARDVRATIASWLRTARP